MIKQLIPATMLTLILTVLCGLAYPLLMTQVAGNLFPAQAHGSLVSKGNTILGSSLIGQTFTKPEYFHPRPSATTTADPQDATKTVPAPYNAANSSASNASFTAKAQVEAVKANADAVKAENPESAETPVPADLTTASGSGLDPHISPEGAKYQAARIADVRRIKAAEIEALIDAQTENRLFGLFGSPVVNVLRLNLTLDERWPLKLN